MFCLYTSRKLSHHTNLYVRIVSKTCHFLNPPTHSNDYVIFEWSLMQMIIWQWGFFKNEQNHKLDDKENEKIWWNFWVMGIDSISKSFFMIGACKVHIFWEGHTLLRNLHLTLVLCSCQSIMGWRFRKILWPSQNVWTLPLLLLCLFTSLYLDCI